MLPQLAEGDANKVFVIPSEFDAGVRRHRRGAGSAAPTQELKPTSRARTARPMFDSLAEKLQGTLSPMSATAGR